MVKKSLVILLLVLGFIFGIVVVSAPSVLGFSVWNISHAIQVSTSMSAKLGCSARYVTELNKAQIVDDLSSYSPVARSVTMQYDDVNKRVSTDLFGFAPITAQFRAGMGCSLVMNGYGAQPPVPVELLPPNTDTWSTGHTVSAKDNAIQTTLNTILEQDNVAGFNTRALIVVKGDQIIAESYAEGINETTKLLGWSMGKSFTAIMLARMQQLGMVTLNQSDLFPKTWKDERRQLTLKQLLQMSSGLSFDETYAPGSDATHMLFTAPSASDVAMASPLIQTPGEYFSYSSGTTNLLNRFMHEQLGQSSQASIDFLYQQIFQPLGMADSVFETDSSGVFVGSSYLYASARDWARLGLLMLNKGRVGDQQFIPEAWVEQAHETNNANNDKRYGYQFWLNSAGNETEESHNELRWPKLPKDAYAMMGNREQSVMIIPSKNMVFVRLGWTAGKYPMEEHYAQLLKQAIH